MKAKLYLSCGENQVKMYITVMNIISAVTKEKVGGAVASWSGSGPGRGHCVVFLGASLHPVV